jgi:hypothetical protein
VSNCTTTDGRAALLPVASSSEHAVVSVELTVFVVHPLGIGALSTTFPFNPDFSTQAATVAVMGPCATSCVSFCNVAYSVVTSNKGMHVVTSSKGIQVRHYNILAAQTGNDDKRL